VKRLNGWDAMLLYSETANIPAHTLKILVIDATGFEDDFNFEVFRDWLRGRLPLLDPLRYKLIEVPYRLHHPVWLENYEVDLDYHLRRVRVPRPGGRRELDQTVAEIASGPLDRSRPLWEIHFVEGMTDHRFAAVLKLHHSLADGVAAANLIAHALDPKYDSNNRDGVAGSAAPPTKGELLAAAARDHLHQVTGLPRLIQGTAEGVARMRRRAKERGEQPDLARSFRGPKTFMNHPVSPRRRFATATLSLTDVKQASKHLGTTLNDLVLSSAAGALRQLQLRYDGHADQPIIASVPTSLDTSPDRLWGNELSAMNLSLPVHIDDPLERVRLTSVATAIAKEDIRLLGPTVLESWVGYLPPALSPLWYRWRSKREARRKLVNLPISNVPGPRARGSIGAAAASEIYSVGPLLAGCAMNITVWSYLDQLNIAVLSDDQTLNDPHEATDAIIDAFAEIRCAAGLPAEMTEVTSSMAPAHAIS
jgi:diacylglycerol O-acyltransferase